MTAAPSDSALTQAGFADMTGMSRQRVSRFVREGVIPTNDDGRIPHPAGLHVLIDHLAETAAGRGGGSAQTRLAEERAALARAQREAVELKNAISRGEFVATDEISRSWDSQMTNIRSRMLGIVSDVVVALPHLTRHDADVIDRTIRDALTEAADFVDAAAGGQ